MTQSDWGEETLRHGGAKCRENVMPSCRKVRAGRLNMEHTAYGAQAANVVLDSDGNLVADNVFHGFDETVKQQIRKYLHPQKEEPSEVKQEKPVPENWQKAYENGEYLRSAEITEEQNYNMIDGRMNNLSLKPRKIGERISVLDRLHLKQAEIARRSGKPVPQMAAEEDMERRRK